jgi:hypothetical protein
MLINGGIGELKNQLTTLNKSVYCAKFVCNMHYLTIITIGIDYESNQRLPRKNLAPRKIVRIFTT